MMFQVDQYLASGIIEQYCLGLTTPEEAKELEHYCFQYETVRLELKAVQDALLAYNQQFGKNPPSDTGGKILNSIEELKFETANFDSKGHLSEFISVSHFSSINKWQHLVSHIKPPADYENIHLHEIFNNGGKELYVAWAKMGVDDELHTDLKEKFLILEGTCRCQVGNEFLVLGPGGFLDIPLHTIHNLRVTSNGPVKVILSKEKLAA